MPPFTYCGTARVWCLACSSRRWRRCRWSIDRTAHGPKILVRTDSAGATHAFAPAACRERGVGFSLGFPVDARVQDAVDTLNLGEVWYPAIDAYGIAMDRNLARRG